MRLWERRGSGAARAHDLGSCLRLDMPTWKQAQNAHASIKRDESFRIHRSAGLQELGTPACPKHDVAGGSKDVLTSHSQATGEKITGKSSQVGDVIDNCGFRRHLAVA